jgi:hypothetical protein
MALRLKSLQRTEKNSYKKLQRIEGNGRESLFKSFQFIVKEKESYNSSRRPENNEHSPGSREKPLATGNRELKGIVTKNRREWEGILSKSLQFIVKEKEFLCLNICLQN